MSILILRDTLDSCPLGKGLSVGVDHGVAVLFDADSEQRILRAADAVQEGVGLREMGAMPHISLGVFRSGADVETLASCVEILAGDTAQFELRLSAVGAFPGDDGVIFLTPTPTSDLLDLHSRFHAMVGKHALLTDPVYQPDQWVPHCTIAQAVPEDRVPEAIEQLRNADAFGPVTVVSINLTEFLPVRELVAHPVIGEAGENVVPIRDQGQ